MDIKANALAINSTLIVVTTSLIGTLLHESAHWVTARFLAVQATLHHNYVSIPDNMPPQLETIIAAVGPLFSLCFGCLVLILATRLLKPSLLRLFMLWLGMNNVLLFFGYLLIAPMLANGDTGKVFAYFQVPVYISIPVAVGSFIFLNRLFGRLASEFAYYSLSPTTSQTENRRQLFLYPILISIIVGVGLSFPIPIWFSLLPALFMPMTYFSTMGAYKRLHNPKPLVVIDRVSVSLVLLTLLTISLFRYLV